MTVIELSGEQAAAQGLTLKAWLQKLAAVEAPVRPCHWPRGLKEWSAATSSTPIETPSKAVNRLARLRPDHLHESFQCARDTVLSAPSRKAGISPVMPVLRSR